MLSSGLLACPSSATDATGIEYEKHGSPANENHGSQQGFVPGVYGRHGMRNIQYLYPQYQVAGGGLPFARQQSDAAMTTNEETGTDARQQPSVNPSAIPMVPMTYQQFPFSLYGFTGRPSVGQSTHQAQQEMTPSMFPGGMMSPYFMGAGIPSTPESMSRMMMMMMSPRPGLYPSTIQQYQQPFLPPQTASSGAAGQQSSMSNDEKEGHLEN